MTNRISVILLAALTLCCPLGAHALSISVQVDGLVSFVDDDDGLLGVSASVGDAWSIRYVISSIAPWDACQLDDQSGCYYDVIESMTSTIAGNSVTVIPSGEFSSFQISANMDFIQDGDDRWSVLVLPSPFAVFPPDDVIRVMGVDLYGPGDSALVAAESYLPVPDFAFATQSVMSFTVARYLEDFAYYTDDSIQGRVTGINQVINVPEPSAAWLMLGGLMALAASGRHRRWH